MKRVIGRSDQVVKVYIITLCPPNFFKKTLQPVNLGSY